MAHGITLRRTAPCICAAVALPPLHRDPCDRMIIAAALSHKLAIITADRVIPTYPGVKTVW